MVTFFENRRFPWPSIIEFPFIQRGCELEKNQIAFLKTRDPGMCRFLYPRVLELDYSILLAMPRAREHLSGNIHIQTEDRSFAPTALTQQIARWFKRGRRPRTVRCA